MVTVSRGKADRGRIPKRRRSKPRARYRRLRQHRLRPKSPNRTGFCPVDTELGIALFELDQAFDEPFALISPVSLPPGSFVAAVSVEPDQRLRITPGHLVSTEQTMRSEQDLESFVVSFE